MNPPLVSVVMPVYNGEKYLREAIESILRQTFTDFEFIIINDGSTDRSRAIAASYADARMRLVDNERNLGLVASLNKGIDLAKGKYIARMDADDVSLPTRFERQCLMLEETRADICGCHWLVMNESGKFIDVRLMPLDPEAFTVYLMYAVPFAHGSVMIRRAFLEKNSLRYGGVKYAEDYDFWTRLFGHGARFVNVNEFLFHYREFGGGLSKRLSKGNAADTRAIRRRFILGNRNACEAAMRAMLDRYFELSITERLYLVLGAVRLFTMTGCLLVWRVLKRADLRSMGVATLLILKGY